MCELVVLARSVCVGGVRSRYSLVVAFNFYGIRCVMDGQSRLLVVGCWTNSV